MNKATTPKPAALITGGTSGIGLELAKIFVKEGHDVVIVSENEAKLQSAAAELKSLHKEINIKTITADLAKPEGPEIVYSECKRQGIDISILVNNAGVGVYGEFAEETSLEAELAMIQLNIISVVQLTKLFVPEMVERRFGKILITASLVAITSNPLLTVYAATKAFDYIFAEGLREELKDKGVTVSALLPGGTDTNFFSRAGMEETKIAQETEKLADPADVAQAGYDALMKGKDHVVAGFKNKIMAAIADVAPKEMIAHMAKPKKAS